MNHNGYIKISVKFQWKHLIQFSWDHNDSDSFVISSIEAEWEKEREMQTSDCVLWDLDVYKASVQNILFPENNKQSEMNLQTGLQKNNDKG